VEKGKLIVLEGLDGCGKTTQQGLLYNALNREGLETIAINNVSDSIFGKTIRAALADRKYCVNSKQMAALYIAELHYVTETIKEAIYSGKNVICSRHYLSTLAYAGTDDSVVNGIIELSKYDIMPDVIYYIGVPFKTIHERLTKNSNPDFYETSHKQKEVLERYEYFTHPDNEPFGTPIVKIDGSLSVYAIVTLILQDLYPRLSYKYSKDEKDPQC